mmetsp:Transcript_4993/g.16377  ORF Transcript_4993/g.16377 Transcript_4993/m.16377 type:complete len:377 (+) Transcript_4993:104-1234(+)
MSSNGVAHRTRISARVLSPALGMHSANTCSCSRRGFNNAIDHARDAAGAASSRKSILQIPPFSLAFRTPSIAHLASSPCSTCSQATSNSLNGLPAMPNPSAFTYASFNVHNFINARAFSSSSLIASNPCRSPLDIHRALNFPISLPNRLISLSTSHPISALASRVVATATKPSQCDTLNPRTPPTVASHAFNLGFPRAPMSNAIFIAPVRASSPSPPLALARTRRANARASNRSGVARIVARSSSVVNLAHASSTSPAPPCAAKNSRGSYNHTSATAPGASDARDDDDNARPHTTAPILARGARIVAAPSPPARATRRATAARAHPRITLACAPSNARDDDRGDDRDDDDDDDADERGAQVFRCVHDDDDDAGGVR